MGLADIFSDIYASLSWTEVHAEAAEEKDEEDSGEQEEGKDEGGDDESAEEDGEGDDGKDGDDEGADDDEEEDEDEEEEEEPEDPKPKLEEECANSSQCSGPKHHFDECVSRVTAMQEDESYKGPHEDCVEEFFHLQHCATQCAAPKLWRMLK